MAIDLNIPVDLAEAMELPECQDIELPQPGLPQITLPTGGTLKAVADLSKGIPSDCSLNLNLLAQIAPLLGSIECLVNLLKLIKPLIDIVQVVPKIPKELPTPEMMQEFAEAADALKDCLLVPTPAIIIPFVKDILCLILKILQCAVAQLSSIVELLGGLEIQLQVADENGNTELARVIGCAQKNAELSAQHTIESLGSVEAVLDLLGPFLGIAGVEAIQLPTFTSSADLQGLNQSLQALQNLVDTLQAVVDAPPINGCST
jgi:hypothetical protein